MIMKRKMKLDTAAYVSPLCFLSDSPSAGVLCASYGSFHNETFLDSNDVYGEGEANNGWY